MNPPKHTTVLLTGASQGIGEQTARDLAALGYDLILVARNFEKLEQLVLELESNYPINAVAYALDLTDLKAIDRFCDSFQETRIDVVVHNAGYSIRRPLLATYERFSDFERLMQINFYGPLRMTQNLLPQLVKQDKAHIVYTSSFATTLFPANFAAYTASKIAFEAYLSAINVEYKREGISTSRVIMPLVNTAMIGPAKSHYGWLPILTVEKGAKMLKKAIIKKPQRVANWFGRFGVLMEFLSPRLRNWMNHRIFCVEQGARDKRYAGYKAKFVEKKQRAQDYTTPINPNNISE
jgi:short-subunit dehydrogenase